LLPDIAIPTENLVFIGESLHNNSTIHCISSLVPIPTSTVIVYMIYAQKHRLSFSTTITRMTIMIENSGLYFLISTLVFTANVFWIVFYPSLVLFLAALDTTSSYSVQSML